MKYMDKIDVRDNKLDSVFTLGFVLFRDTIVRHSPIKDYLRGTLSSIIMQARHGEVIDGLALLSAYKMLIKLGITDTHVYEEDFEHPFFVQSQSRIVQVVEEELIKKPMNTILEMKNFGFIFMLKNQRTQDLVYMYKM
ncbi:Cullin, N-terminal,Cullin repeat-like-containing domain [Cinara cedri]|uniref:Cullin, N-terminal,Cullin repeat-like-containing domain n=1 Tax=Cinara cedri TaxID=506608 RepID=A0A5E4MHS8_9HEMI|nr:Cullin, N-terminal,Cullin repeat-like-containing domain [Cinara cedri]